MVKLEIRSKTRVLLESLRVSSDVCGDGINATGAHADARRVAYA